MQPCSIARASASLRSACTCTGHVARAGRRSSPHYAEQCTQLRTASRRRQWAHARATRAPRSRPLRSAQTRCQSAPPRCTQTGPEPAGCRSRSGAAAPPARAHACAGRAAAAAARRSAGGAAGSKRAAGAACRDRPGRARAHSAHPFPPPHLDLVHEHCKGRVPQPLGHILDLHLVSKDGPADGSNAAAGQDEAAAAAAAAGRWAFGGACLSRQQ